MLSAEQIDALEALLAKASHGEWTACRMVHADRGDDMTPRELGTYVENSVMKSEAESLSSEFLAILVQKPDGPADVCLVGNGPTSPANATLIAALRNAAPALLASARTLARIREECSADLDAYRKADAACRELASGSPTLWRERDDDRQVAAEAVAHLLSSILSATETER